MNIKEVIRTLNQMETDGVIERYAIGGAVGATFYLEPVATLDVDVFVTYKHDSEGSIVSLHPIYEYLTARGHVIEREHIVIAESPVQFLPSTNALAEEALNEAIQTDVDDLPVRVFTAEHLAAIALQAGRPKDKARLVQFVEAGALDTKRFHEILARHELLDKWQRFERQYLTD